MNSFLIYLRTQSSFINLVVDRILVITILFKKMDVKELRFHVDTVDSDQDSTDIVKDKEDSNGVCYENKGFNDSCSSKEELSDKVGAETNHTSKDIVVLDEPAMTSQDGYVNNAFEEGPQKADKVNDKHNGTVPLAHESTVITSTSLENQISKLDEDNNGVVAVNLETKEKKWKIQSVGWDSNKSIILLGLVLAFDAWAAVFYCFKSNVITNIFD